MILQANALKIPLADKSVYTCVTSPPYWGLRDYGTATWEGGEQMYTCEDCDITKPLSELTSGCPKCEQTMIPVECDHLAGVRFSDKSGIRDTSNQNTITENAGKGTPFRDVCGKCGAHRIDAQLGLEPTPEEFVANMVAVFREVWRVLRDDGTCWLNLGDSYAAGGTYSNNNATGSSTLNSNPAKDVAMKNVIIKKEHGLKPKDLCGIPWRVAFALQADGWYLRSDIIWHKPNPMPESVTDRPTKAHEYIFLLSKKARYYYDADAVREKAQYGYSDWSHDGNTIFKKSVGSSKAPPGRGKFTVKGGEGGSRNRRTVWTVTTKPYKGAHFATFPPDLIEPCVLAGCPETVCSKCGAGHVRVVEKTTSNRRDKGDGDKLVDYGMYSGRAGETSSETLGFSPTCECSGGTSPGIVLDPFFGSGTTGMVAIKHKRHFVGLDLSAEYIELAKRRTSNVEVRLF